MFFVCCRLFDTRALSRAYQRVSVLRDRGQTITASAGAVFDPELASLNRSLITFYRIALLNSYYYVINVKSSQDPNNELPFFKLFCLLIQWGKNLWSALHDEPCLPQSDCLLLGGPAFVPRCVSIREGVISDVLEELSQPCTHWGTKFDFRKVKMLLPTSHTWLATVNDGVICMRRDPCDSEKKHWSLDE